MTAWTNTTCCSPPPASTRCATALTRAGFTSNGIADRLGPQATGGVARNDYRAALRATEDRRPAGHPDPGVHLRPDRAGGGGGRRAGPADRSTEALAGGLVERHGDGLRAGVDLEPYGDDWWVLADVPASARPGRPLHAEHVLGIGGATQTLIGATIRRPVDTALDLGTGSGVQALHLATHAGRVTATDLSERALRFAATTAALNGQDWELLRGDLVAPVAGRRFDLVVSNPPFVVGPGTTTHVYRDSGRVGDAIGAELAAAAPDLLTEGGTMQYLANWVHVAGEDWDERVAGWFAGTGLDAWVIQREVADPMAYVNLWLTDAGEDRRPAADGGLAGLVRRAQGGGDRLRHRLAAPRRPRPTRWSGWRTCASGSSRRWATRSPPGSTGRTGCAPATPRRCSPPATGPPTGLQLRQEATMGDEGWAVDRQVLAMPHGLRWTRGDRPAGARPGRRRRRPAAAARPARPARRRARRRRRTSWPRRPARSWRTWWSAASSSR